MGSAVTSTPSRSSSDEPVGGRFNPFGAQGEVDEARAGDFRRQAEVADVQAGEDAFGNGAGAAPICFANGMAQLAWKSPNRAVLGGLDEAGQRGRIARHRFERPCEAATEFRQEVHALFKPSR